MTCEKCKQSANALAVNTAITKNKYWCKACLTKAGGKFPEALATSDIEARLTRERAERIAASELYQARRKVNERKALRREIRKSTKARKKAVLLINKLRRT